MIMKVTTYKFLQYEENKLERKWTEEITTVLKENETIADNARNVIDHFNDTCRPNEPHRVFVIARPIATKGNLKHNFQKHSLVTERGGYDIYKCTRCGATGKRHGLSSGITIDKRFTEFCKL